MNRVEFGGGDDFGQFLHVDGFDVENVCEGTQVSREDETVATTRLTEGLIGNVEIPKVDSEIVGGHVRLPVGVDGDGVDVVGVGVGVDLARDGGDDGVVISHAG